MKVIAKTKFFKPVTVRDDKVELLLYVIEDEKWIEHTFRSSKTSNLEKMLIYAQNLLSITQSTTNVKNKYVVVEVESPGLKALRVEGTVSNVHAILFPVPQPVKTIAFFKKEDGELREVHRINFNKEYWIYDSAIYVKDLEYDSILIETIEDKRIVFKDEIMVPIRSKVIGKKERKKIRRKKKKRRTRKSEKTKKKKVRKKTRKKSRKKKTKRKSGKRTRKSKGKRSRKRRKRK